jgi:CRP-like cAMP-binding protein
MLAHLNDLVKKFPSRKYSAGSIVLYQGEVPRQAIILVKGVLKASTISSSGDEQIISFHGPGDVMPMSWIFGKTPSTLYFYEASTDCEVVLVPREKLIEQLMHPKNIKTLVDRLVTDHAASSIRISALEQPKARDKLTYTLYYLCQRYGQPKRGRIHINLSLTHQNLGALVGLTRETTATEMSKLKKEGVLSYRNQNYHVDIEKLLNIVGEDSFRDIQIAE